jgi:hypothetical protein
MTAKPGAAPDTTPEPGNTVATEKLLEVQVPPGIILARVVLKPTQVLSIPVLGAVGCTVTVAETAHPMPIV